MLRSLDGWFLVEERSEATAWHAATANAGESGEVPPCHRWWSRDLAFPVMFSLLLRRRLIRGYGVVYLHWDGERQAVVEG